MQTGFKRMDGFRLEHKKGMGISGGMSGVHRSTKARKCKEAVSRHLWLEEGVGVGKIKGMRLEDKWLDWGKSWT